MKLSEDEFWRMTPAQFDALSKRRLADLEQQDYRAGLICSVLANVNRDSKKQPKPFKPQDFMPQKKVKREQTPEDMLAMVEMLNAAFGGRDLR